MKLRRFLSFALAALFAICVAPAAFATQVPDYQSNVSFTEYFSDGSCAKTEIVEMRINAKSSTKTGMKTYTFKDSDGVTLWSYSVTGTFSYVAGVSSVCTAVSDSYSISNSSWVMGSHSCSKSGNVATGNFSMERKFLFITTETISRTVTLTCDTYGNLT